jgi:phage terminase large subunit-like protein
MAKRRGSSPVPDCGYSFDGKVCNESGPHYCEPRADKVVSFFAEVLVHTKSDWARQIFRLADWQEHDIIRPLFGTVVYSLERRRYVRRYRVAWIELGRKNGKSELAAGLVLYLLIADDEEGAEIYGAARTTKQAGKVGEVVERMRQLSPALNADISTNGERGRLKYNKNSRRIYDEDTGSYYEIIPADEQSELGHNPHAVVIDEVLAQADGAFWNSQRTAMGTRAQAIMVGLTTAGNDPSSFAAVEHAEMARVMEDPSRAPHVFVYMRNLPANKAELAQVRRSHPKHPDLPVSCDPWNEKNWHWPNPALGDFLSIDALREEALESKNDPTKENSFRQFRLNQWVSQVTRWMQLHLWDKSAGMVDEASLVGRTCWAGLDLASTTDLAAWVLLFPPDDPDQPIDVLWRFWTPEAQLATLDLHTGGQATVWAKAGLLHATEGDWIDYTGDPDQGMSHSAIIGKTAPSIHRQILNDSQKFRILGVGYDQREATSTAQYMQEIGLSIEPVYQGFGLSGSLKELMRLVKSEMFRHGGHPVARWNADSAEVKQDDQERLKVVKPRRDESGKRIDGIAAAANAIYVMAHAAVDEGSGADSYFAGISWTCSCGGINANRLTECSRCGLPHTQTG